MASSGSSAIVMALQALGIGPGHRVLVPATTWVACASSVLRVGAEPVFVDAQPDSPCADLDNTSIPQVDGVLAVHTYASQVNVAALRARLPGIPIIEDCSHAHGAWAATGQPLGSFGDLSLFSFQATKVLASGEGGAVVTDDLEMALKLTALATDSRRLVSSPGAGALNCLEPADSVHGANHSMSEFSSAVLWEQLNQLPELAVKRASGLRFLSGLLDEDAGSLIFDETSAASGGFYGVPFCPRNLSRPDYSEAIEYIRGACGAQIDRVYPPIPLSPLYRPWTVRTYGHGPPPSEKTVRTTISQLPNSVRWHEGSLLLPHALFLADHDALANLGEALNQVGRGRLSCVVATSPQPGHKTADVCVIVVTSGMRNSLADALRTVAAQSYTGPCSVLVLCDDQNGSAARVPTLITESCVEERWPIRMVNVSFGRMGAPTDTYSRVALLRNVALTMTTASRVSFLDDDNLWDSDHLSSLVELMDESGVPAVHSWRRLLSPDGRPYVPTSFPWLANPDAAIKRLRQLQDVGVFENGSDVVRDRMSVMVDGEDLGMVDMNEWLLDRNLINLIGFEIERTQADVINRIGEDDKLLQRLRDLLVPIRCTERATLLYRLGGYSNSEYVTSSRENQR